MGIWENLGMGGYRGFSRPAARLLQQAVQLAVDFTLRCIEVTRTDPQAAWYGVEFERALPMLTERAKALEPSTP